MTIETWKAEFYPVEASEVSVKDAVAHSLKKWEGLRQENLEKHGVNICGTFMSDSAGAFRFDDLTCSLCRANNDACTTCSLSKCRGGVPCCTDMVGEGVSPYEALIRDDNPESMIRWLKKAQEYEANHG